MKIAMTGSSGLIGTALVQHLRAGGAQVTRIVRKPAVGPAEISWDPSAGIIDASRLEGMDAVVHLAGAGVGSGMVCVGFFSTQNTCSKACGCSTWHEWHRS